MKIKKNKLIIDILLIFVGAILFTIGTIYKQISTMQNTNLIYILKSLDLSYPLLYLLFAISLSIYKLFKFKKNNL